MPGVGIPDKKKPPILVENTIPQFRGFLVHLGIHMGTMEMLINDFLIKAECICLCANCNAMLTKGNFEKNIRFILGEEYIKEEKIFLNT